MDGTRISRDQGNPPGQRLEGQMRFNHTESKEKNKGNMLKSRRVSHHPLYGYPAETKNRGNVVDWWTVHKADSSCASTAAKNREVDKLARQELAQLWVPLKSSVARAVRSVRSISKWTRLPSQTHTARLVDNNNVKSESYSNVMLLNSLVNNYAVHLL